MAPHAQVRLPKPQSAPGNTYPTPATTAGSTTYDRGLPSTAGTFHGSLESRPQTSHSDGKKHHHLSGSLRRKQDAHSLSSLSFTRSVGKRLALDSTLAPSLIDLRINRINLTNEVRVHGGQVISSKIAGMRPTSRPAWPGSFTSRLGRRGRHLELSLIEYHKLKARELESSLQQDPSMSFTWQDGKYTLDTDEHDWFETGSPKGKKKRNTVDPDIMGRPRSPIIKSYGDGNAEQSERNEVAELMADPRVVEVFDAFKDEVHGGLARKKVYRALQAISSSVYTATDELRSVVEDIMRTLKLGGHDDQQLTLQTFCLVIQAVHEIRHAHLKDRFTQLDTDCSGKISVAEFRSLAWDMGFTLSSSEMRELFEECDTDHSGGLDQEEFARTAESMVHNFGFNKRQLHKFEELFDRYDQDRSGKLSAEELSSALGWFGTPTQTSVAEEMIALCGEDNDGSLTRTEFLRAMRMRLEQEMAGIRTEFAVADDDLSGQLDFVEVSNLVFRCGYRLSSREALQDCIDQAQQQSTSPSKDGALFFEDVVELIGLLRACEGFSEAELKEFYEVFDRFNRHTGHMREFELNRAIHWLGYPVTPQQLRELWCIADMDKTGTLERAEFLKIMRLLNEKEVEEAYNFVQTHNSTSSFTEEAVADLLAILGYVMPHSVILEAMAEAVPKNKLVDLQSVMLIIRLVREAQVQKLRQCHGVLDHIASKVRARFGRRIKLGKAIKLEDLEQLIVEIYPAAKNSPRELEVMENICKGLKTESDPDGTDLDGAYKAISDYEEHRVEEQWRREQAIAEAAGFPPSKVAHFRGIFVSADTNHHGYLNGAEVLPLLDQEHFPDVTPTGIGNMKETLSNLGTRQECIEFITFLEILALGYGPRCDTKLAQRQAKAFLRTNPNLSVNRVGSKGGAFGKTMSTKERVKSLLLPLKKPPRLKDFDEQSEPTPDETLAVGPDEFGLTQREWEAVQQLWCDPWPIGARLQKVICELRKCDRDEIPTELADDASNAISKGNFTFHQFAAWLAKNATDAQLEARLRPARDRGRRGFDVNMIPNIGH